MSDSPSPEQLGPVELIALAFHQPNFDGSVLRELVDLVDRGVIRVLDLIVVHKLDDGSGKPIYVVALTLRAGGGELGIPHPKDTNSTITGTDGPHPHDTVGSGSADAGPRPGCPDGTPPEDCDLCIKCMGCCPTPPGP